MFTLFSFLITIYSSQAGVGPSVPRPAGALPRHLPGAGLLPRAAGPAAATPPRPGATPSPARPRRQGKQARVGKR